MDVFLIVFNDACFVNARLYTAKEGQGSLLASYLYFHATCLSIEVNLL